MVIKIIARGIHLIIEITSQQKSQKVRTNRDKSYQTSLHFR